MKAHSISISGILTLDLHALNNEGAEGNTMMTRMVDIIDKNGNRHTVNAISGDMFKHIQAGHLLDEALESGLALCAACRRFDANRICGDPDFTKNPELAQEDCKDSVILTAAIKRCAIDDLEGILITSEMGKKRSIARKSCIEFGWVVGIPDQVATESYFHAKYVPEGRGEGRGDAANLGQNIFHRPASSGRYAMVVGMDLFRVGRNDISLDPVLDKEDRINRCAALVRSAMNAIVKPTGAHRNTQNPHIINFEGVVAVSCSSLPAPAVSALNSGFVEETKRIELVLNQMQSNSVSTHVFDSLAGFTEMIAQVLGPNVARAVAGS